MGGGGRGVKQCRSLVMSRLAVAPARQSSCTAVLAEEHMRSCRDFPFMSGRRGGWEGVGGEGEGVCLVTLCCCPRLWKDHFSCNALQTTSDIVCHDSLLGGEKEGQGMRGQGGGGVV